MWFVYLLECADKSLYYGVSNNLARRLAAHNGEIHGGARYTRSRRPVRLVAALHCVDKSFALRLEWVLKSVPKAYKRDVLIQLGGIETRTGQFKT